ncbi:BTAD domain-containing putative transcriptional regulator [Dactylosporangium sucinum]|uniref:OmpR/PhoB-type domain-containing protein n=1 Tax=Dactylosporangium sucinum TaxID=1424081 RepID=A0A917TRN2_9ACTN|nr:BTAD domain-containing putative transcriptional regulator [Dactylosporangium sucinum]GGM34934.1 hypothetical protein GCM10007977_040520 [Dactylosporangium sucinum]
MRFSVLGLVSVSDGTETVVLPSSKPTSLLAALLLRPNQTVRAEYLQHVVWESSPPSSAKATLQTYVLRLRRIFRNLGFAESVIETVPGGYRFPATAATLDLVEFRELVAGAPLSASPRAELDLLRRALALWQGPPLANIQSGLLQRDDLPALTEEWLRAAERRFDLELEVGPHREVIAELRSAVREHPGYERFWEQLIELLYRSGRQADALNEYGNVKRYLRDQLGIDPGSGLQRLELAILRGETPEPRAGAAQRRPPSIAEPDPPHFTGRAVEMEALLSWLSADKPAPLVVISGPPGIGKTALAVHVAHAVRATYPDQRHVVRMTDAGGAPRPAAEIAAEVAHRRSAAADPARTLLVFDDVAGAAQLRPLLDAGASGATIVTSRSSLAGLATRRGSVVLRLGPLDPADSVRLLAANLGAGVRVDAGTALAVAEACGHFPAALLIAAIRLSVAGPGAFAASVAGLTADPMGWLTVGPDRAMSVFHLFDSYLSALKPQLVEAFHAVARAPVDEPRPASADDLLEDLVDASLLEAGRGGEYRMYPLFSSYATASALAMRPA